MGVRFAFGLGPLRVSIPLTGGRRRRRAAPARRRPHPNSIRANLQRSRAAGGRVPLETQRAWGIAPPETPTPPPSGRPGSPLAGELGRIWRLHQDGALSREEYDLAKHRLLGG